MNKFIKISISFIIFGLVLIGLATYLNNGHVPIKPAPEITNPNPKVSKKYEIFLS